MYLVEFYNHGNIRLPGGYLESNLFCPEQHTGIKDLVIIINVTGWDIMQDSKSFRLLERTSCDIKILRVSYHQPSDSVTSAYEWGKGRGHLFEVFICFVKSQLTLNLKHTNVI